jgi:hypothetical protein
VRGAGESIAHHIVAEGNFIFTRGGIQGKVTCTLIHPLDVNHLLARAGQDLILCPREGCITFLIIKYLDCRSRLKVVILGFLQIQY